MPAASINLYMGHQSAVSDSRKVQLQSKSHNDFDD